MAADTPLEIRHELTILAVEDLAESLAFYKAAFGWPLKVEVPVYAEFELPKGQRLGLYEREAFGKNTGAAPARIPAGALAPTELYFYTSDVHAAIERLERAGARLLSALSERAWGDEAVYFADPTGNVVVIARG